MRLYHLYNGKAYTGKTTSLYWAIPGVSFVNFKCGPFLTFIKVTLYVIQSNLHHTVCDNGISYAAWDSMTMTSVPHRQAKQCLFEYSVVPLQRGQFSPKSLQKTPHSSPIKASYGVSFVGSISGILLQSLQWCIQYYVIILDSIITAPNCILEKKRSCCKEVWLYYAKTQYNSFQQ